MTAIHSEIRAKAHDTRSENWRRKIDSIFSRRFSAPAFRAKACPHLFPKTATLYPETGDFVAVFSNKIASFRIQSLLFRKQVWTGHYCAL